MHLAHGDNLAVVYAHRLLHVANVLADDLRVVADPIGDVESGVNADTLAAAPAHEAVQQTQMRLPLWNRQVRDFHWRYYVDSIRELQGANAPGHLTLTIENRRNNQADRRSSILP